MKWILLIVPMLVKQFSQAFGSSTHPMEEFKELLRENSLKILVALSLLYITASLFLFGVLFIILDIAAQLDAGISPKLSAVMISGYAMIFSSLILFLIGVYYSKSSQRKVTKPQVQNIEHPLESALVLLINDFVEEREFKRKMKKSETDKRDRDEKEHHPDNFKSNDAFEKH